MSDPTPYDPRARVESMDVLVASVLAAIAQRGTAPELPTGLTTLDEAIWGLHRSELTVLAGRPGEGKTALALQIAVHLADAGKRVLFLSLEMTREQITERMLVQLTQVDAWNLRRGQGLEELRAKLQPLDGYFAALPLRLIDGTGYTAEQVRHVLQQMVEQGGGVPDVLVVDFVQLASIEQGQTPPQAIQEYMRALKEIAMRYRIAVLALSQLNRESTKAAKGRPRLEHLKGAGAIEELSDCAILCWWEQLGTEERPEGTKYWLLVEKQRNGPVGAQIPVRFLPEKLTFESVEPVVDPWQATGGPVASAA